MFESLAERNAYPMALAIESRSVDASISFQYFVDAHMGSPPASLPITTVHAPALFIASAFKNASLLSLKKSLSGVSAICASAFPFPLMSAEGWEEAFLRPNGFGTRLISDPKAPLILSETLITATDFWKWSTNKVVVAYISSLYLDTHFVVVKCSATC